MPRKILRGISYQCFILGGLQVSIVTNKGTSGIANNAGLENACICRNCFVHEDELYKVRARCLIACVPLTAERNEFRVQSHQK